MNHGVLLNQLIPLTLRFEYVGDESAPLVVIDAFQGQVFLLALDGFYLKEARLVLLVIILYLQHLE